MTIGRAERTDQTRLRIKRDRGAYDRRTIHSILDAAPMCHLGYLVDGEPRVTPTFHWREGEHVYWHGSRRSGALLAATDTPVCLTVSLLDGLVLARSGFHHSANYRSVMIFGTPTQVEGIDEKLEKAKAFVEKLFPGRWDSLRPATRKEMNATTILSLPIEEASAKVRIGGSIDSEEDRELPIWAGVLPVKYAIGDPIAEPDIPQELTVPKHVRDLKIG